MPTHPDGAHSEDLGGPLRALMRTHGFAACDRRMEIVRFHRLARRLIPGTVAAVDALQAVQNATGSSLFLRAGETEDEAFLALFAFSPAGEHAFASGAFSSLRPDPIHVCAPSKATTQGYVWGFGGTHRGARFRVLRALRHMRQRLFPHLTLAARAASPEGRALMAPFGHAASALDPDLFIAPAAAMAESRP